MSGLMLQLVNVSKTFNSGTINEKAALSNVNLEMKKGDFATIVGSNGAGKSTLFNAITGAFYTDTGAIMEAITAAAMVSPTTFFQLLIIHSSS